MSDILSTNAKLDVADLLASSLASSNRRERLCRRLELSCPLCYDEQIQLIDSDPLALWRCRICRYRFVYEPLVVTDDGIAAATAIGYQCVRRLLDSRLIGLQKQLYTFALIVDIDRSGCYSYRYCYEHRMFAERAIHRWDGKGNPPGPWIVRKGLGGEDLYGPGALNN